MLRHRFVRLTLLPLLPLLPFFASTAHASDTLEFPLRAKRILFLGDSITHAGGYVAWIETQLRLQGVAPLPQIINIGLSSETCCGLSEPGHPFPRPDVHERLGRALAKVKPDVVVACYGMNDGIYFPFSKERFQAYQEGINRLIKKVHASGAKLILMAPTPFDPVPLQGKGRLLPAGQKKYAYDSIYEKYDDVLGRYGRWIMQQKNRVEMVIDLHRPLANDIAEKRKRNPRFTLAPDGIHPNAEGHRLMGQTILHAWGVVSTAEPDPELLKRITHRTALLHDAWLSDIGHKHPRIKPGPPLEKAIAKARQLEKQIEPLVQKARQPALSQRRSTGGTIYQVHYNATAQPGQLRLAADYSLWIPDGESHLRGVIVHQHGCGPGSTHGSWTATDDLHWQALARKWDCALLGPSMESPRGALCRLWCDPRNGSGARFLQGLSKLAQTSHHAELETVPWCLWGHSGGGFWSSLMQTKYPQRIVAIWFQSGTAYGYWTNETVKAPVIPAAAYGVPAMGNPGLKEKGNKRFHTAWDGLTAMRMAYLKHGEFFEFAPDPRTAHECGNSRYLAIPFFDFWLEHRLPATGSRAQKLRPVDAQARADWNKTMAGKLAEFVHTGAVSDTTPPPAPVSVAVRRDKDGSVAITWKAVADFESGIRCFVIERNGKPIAQVPEEPKNQYGRPLFQGMTYGDTPQKPWPEMQFVDKSVPTTGVPTYRVRTINTVGLKSNPTAE